jgi:hypothetical protein
LEYATQGGWLPVVSTLLRWLSVAGCFEYVHRLEREVRSLPTLPLPHVETAALNAIRSSLARLYNDPPKHLTQEQRKELIGLRRQALRSVQYRLRQIASGEERAEQAAKSLGPRLEAYHKARLASRTTDRQDDQKKSPLSKDEREVVVRQYLKAHKGRAAKGEVGIREVEQETGVPASSISGTTAWQALQDRLDKKGLSRRPRRRKAQAYTNAMDEVVQNTDTHAVGPATEDAELQGLIREQAGEDDGSPPDKGRRGRVRVRKKF